MSTNKKFRIQNGADIVGELSINDVTVIGADGKVVEGAVADAVASLTAADIADLQSQVSAILGTSPETLDTLQEIVAAFEGADSSLTQAVSDNSAAHTANTAAIAATNARTAGISTSSGSADIQMTADVDMDGNSVTNMADPSSAQDAATKAYVDAASTSSGSDLSTETAARIAGDDTLQANIDAEATTRSGLGSQLLGYININGAAITAEETARIAGDAANSAEVTAAIATASADATAKADSAEAAAKAYADQVVASTVDAAPAALDTLNELAAALGDDANFASTVTASIAAKADDAATTAALDLKEDKTVVAALDTFVKGSSSYSLNSSVNTNIDMWGLGNGASKIGYSNGALSWSMDNTSATGGFNYQQNSLTYLNMSNLVVGTDYVLTITSPSRAGNLTIVVGDSSNTVDAQVVMPAGSTTVTSQIEFTAVATSRLIALDAGSTGVYSISSVQVTDAEVLQTTATQVVPAVNELHAELNALSSTQSGDQSNLQTQITAEVARASAAEAVNAANIVSETSARSSADAALESDIIGLQNQVGTIISGSPASLDTLVEIVSAFETADASLSGVITANSGRLTTAENNITALETDLSAEESARGAGDAALQSQVTAHDGRLTTAESEIDTLQAQMSARIGKDSDHESDLSDETAARIAGDNANSVEVSTEAATRAAADTQLTNDLAVEVARATSAEGVIATDLAQEIIDRQNADSGLQTQINFIKENTDPAALDSLTEIVAAFQAADGSITGVVNSNTSRISSLESGVIAIEAWNTDNVSEGATNKYWTPERTKTALSGGLCITYNSTTGEIKIDEAETEAALRVAESVASDDADKLGGQAPAHYRIDVYDVNGTVVN